MKIICINVLLLVCLNLLGQKENIDKDHEFTYDLLNQKGPFPGDFYVKDGVRVRYRIKNFNKNVYSISINGDTKFLFATQPTIFNIVSSIDISKLTPPQSGNVKAIAVNDPFRNLLNEATEAERQTINQYIAENSKLGQDIQDFTNNYENLKLMNLLYKNLLYNLSDGCNTYESIFANKIKSTFDLLSKDGFEFNGTQNELDLQDGLRSNASSFFAKADDLYSKIQKENDNVKLLFSQVQQIAGKITENINSIKNTKAIKDKTKSNTVKPADKNGSKSVDSSSAKTKDSVISITEELQYQSIIQSGLPDILADIKVADAKITDLEQSGFTDQLVLTYQKINTSNFEYVSPSFKAEKDELTITISITAKDGLECSNNYSQFNGVYTGSVYGFKINFSTGLFIIGGKNLMAQTYRLDTIPGDANNNIIKQNNNKNTVIPAVGALMHFYVKRPGDFSWGGALGFSISNQTNLNYHGGLSFLFGNEQRIILSGGATLTQTNLIADQYSVGQTVSKGITSVPTSNFYRWGYFFSLTYNLSN